MKSTTQSKNDISMVPIFLRQGAQIYLDVKSEISGIRKDAGLLVDNAIFATQAAAHVAPVTAALIGKTFSQDRIHQAGLILSLFDHHIGIVDNYTDDGHLSIDQLHEASLSLLRAQALIANLAESSLVSQHVLNLFLEASNADRELSRLRNGERSATHIRRLSVKKNAVLRAAPILLEGYHSETSARAERYLSGLSDIVQSIDDLIDWQDDLQIGKVSYVLVRASERVVSNDAAAIARELFARGLAAEIIAENKRTARDIFSMVESIEAREVLAECIASLNALGKYFDTKREWSDTPRISREIGRLVSPILAYIK